MGQAIFITGTDTGVGKTIVTAALGLSLQKQGLNVGIMKPFQCSGDDAQFLVKTLVIKDDMKLINPYYADEPLAPSVAFKRKKEKVNLKKVFAAYQELKKRHDILLVEGAGGLLVPIKDKYLVVDLIKDLKIPAIIVARAGLGTINHALLTERYALNAGINVLGVVINGYKGDNLAEKTNPEALKQLLSVPVLAILPFILKINSRISFLTGASISSFSAKVRKGLRRTSGESLSVVFSKSERVVNRSARRKSCASASRKAEGDMIV